MAKNNLPASAYAKPHTMSGKTVTANEAGKRSTQKIYNPEWTPLDGVSIGSNAEVKTSGIKMRGTGAATKGVMSRGPMA